MIKFFKSIIKSIGYGIKDDPEFKRIRDKHPKISKFIKRRLTPSEKYGLYLTVGILITLFFIYLFFEVIQSYIGQEALVQADLRIINLVSHFRTPSLNQFMLFITDLANGKTITIAVIFSLIILFLLKKWSYINSLLIFVIGGEIFVWIIKNIIDRPRPPLTEALITENSYSLPSGHTFVAVAFYGLITFFLFHSLNKKYLRIISLILGIVLVILIGISRIYLGAHWPSDILASYTSGLAWLSIIITITHIKKKFPKKIIPPPNLKHQTILKITILLVIIFSIFVYSFYKKHPLNSISNLQNPKKTIINVDLKLFEELPKISESITGAPAEPINIIIIANQNILNKAFSNSGWFLLDQINGKTINKIINSFLKKQIYPQTPGLPVFWNTKVNDIGFGKPDSNKPASSRHHIHLWETNFATSDNQTIWVGTAHFDKEIKTKGFLVLPIHSVDQLVDNERESIKLNLEENGFLKSFEKISLTGLTYISKSSGNIFLTDGQAYILYLQDK